MQVGTAGESEKGISIQGLNGCLFSSGDHLLFVGLY